MYIYIYIYIHVHIYVYVHIYLYIYVCVYVCMYSCVYIHVCECVCVYIYIYIYIYIYRFIGIVGRMFANGLGDLGSIPNTLKMVLDTSFLNTQQYKVSIKSKVEQSREKSSTLPYTLV